MESFAVFAPWRSRQGRRGLGSCRMAEVVEANLRRLLLLLLVLGFEYRYVDDVGF